MINKTFSDIYSEELAQGAVINDRYDGFIEDYLVLHCLLKIHMPRTFLEIGTNTGWGTKIIKNALGSESIVLSLDLPIEEKYKSLQHPINEGKVGGVGHECDLRYVQLYGDSTEFDYENYPAYGYFIDGEHTFRNAYIETSGALKCKPEIIIWHDADMPEVFEGVMGAMENTNDYELYRVTDTRMMYALKK